VEWPEDWQDERPWRAAFIVLPDLPAAASTWLPSHRNNETFPVCLLLLSQFIVNAVLLVVIVAFFFFG